MFSIKSVFCGIFCFVAVQLGIAQVQYASKMPVEDLEQFFFDGSAKNQRLLIVNYGEAEVVNPAMLKELEGKKIVSVELYYTKFARTKGFNQEQLNDQRVKNLIALNPELFQQPNIKWTLKCQQEGESYDVCTKMVHGFIITFAEEPAQEMADTVGELKSIEE